MFEGGGIGHENDHGDGKGTHEISIHAVGDNGVAAFVPSPFLDGILS